jgi:protein transport protein SEC20
MLLRNRATTKSSSAFSSKSTTKILKEAIEMTDSQMNEGFAALSSLEHSSKTVQKTSEAYNQIQDRLKTSKKVTTRMSRKDQMDRYIFYSGFGILLATVLYIVWRRIWIPFSI